MKYMSFLFFLKFSFIVAFGGIAGLFLGCSLISVMELAYFILVELPVFLYSELKPNNKPMNVVNQLNNERQLSEIPSKSRNWGVNNRIMAVESLHNNDFSIYKNNFNNKTNSLLYK